MAAGPLEVLRYAPQGAIPLAPFLNVTFNQPMVPLATLASTTLDGSGGANWWELIAIGFASDTIKNALVGASAPARQ